MISVEAARRDYGVWVEPKSFELDAQRTTKLRRAKR